MRRGTSETGDYRHYPISNYHDHMKRLKLQRAKFTLAFSKMTFPANVNHFPITTTSSSVSKKYSEISKLLDATKLG